MQSNAAAILSTLKQPTFQSPVEVYSQGQQLINAAQRNQAGALDLQKAQQEQQDASITRAEGAKALQILGETQGDIEAALPRILKEAPTLYQHFKTVADKDKADRVATQGRARAEAIDTAKLLEGSEGPTIDAPNPVVQQAPIPQNLDGTDLQASAPAAPTGSRTLALPLPPVEIPGVAGPSVTVRPQSRQQKEQATQNAEQRKLANEIELARAREQAQRDFAIPPKVNPPNLQSKEIIGPDGKPQFANFNPDTGQYMDPATGKPLPGARPYERPTAAAGSGSDDPKVIAEAIISGNQPPTLTGLYRLAAPVRAELQRRGFDLSTATRDWNAIQKHLSTLNGAQQERLRQAVTFTSDSLDIIDGLYGEWTKVGPASGFKSLNKLALRTAKHLPGKAGEVAQNLEAQINDLVSELGTVYKGGNASTDETLRLAAENLKADWNEQTFKRALEQIRKNLAIRKNSIVNSEAAGVSNGSLYAPKSGAPGAAIGGWSVEVEK